LNKVRFAEFTWERSDAVSTNWPTVLPNPARNALKGKLVTRMQYTNWMTPERMRKTRKASMNLRRECVESMYAVQRDCKAKEDGEDGAGFVSEGVCFAVLDDDLGPAIWLQ